MFRLPKSKTLFVRLNGLKSEKKRYYPIVKMYLYDILLNDVEKVLSEYLNTIRWNLPLIYL